MDFRRISRGAGALVVLSALAAACTPEPTPAPSPTATASPTASATPTETALERQTRLDFEAAEKSYRTFRAELGRVLRAGGAKRASPVMRATAGGSYLRTFEDLVKGYRINRGRDSGRERIVYVKPNGYAPTELLLDACEDTRGVTTYEGEKSRGPGQITVVRLTVRKVAGSWKVWSGRGEEVKACPTA